MLLAATDPGVPGVCWPTVGGFVSRLNYKGLIPETAVVAGYTYAADKAFDYGNTAACSTAIAAGATFPRKNFTKPTAYNVGIGRAQEACNAYAVNFTRAIGISDKNGNNDTLSKMTECIGFMVYRKGDARGKTDRTVRYTRGETDRIVGYRLAINPIGEPTRLDEDAQCGKLKADAGTDLYVISKQTCAHVAGHVSSLAKTFCKPCPGGTVRLSTLSLSPSTHSFFQFTAPVVTRGLLSTTLKGITRSQRLLL